MSDIIAVSSGMPRGYGGRPPGDNYVSRSTTIGTEAARVLGNRVLSCRGSGTCHAIAQRRLLAETGRKLRLSGRSRRWHRRERAAVAHAGFQVAQLALKVGLETAAVLPLERAQVIDPTLKLFTRCDKRAHGLAVPLLSVPFQAFGTRPRVTGNLLRLTAGLGEHVVGLAASAAERLVRLAAGVGDRLVGGLLRQ